MIQDTDKVSTESLYSYFDTVFVPTIKKFQSSTMSSNVGTYVLAYAKVSTISEVMYNIVKYTHTYTHTHTLVQP